MRGSCLSPEASLRLVKFVPDEFVSFASMRKTSPVKVYYAFTASFGRGFCIHDFRPKLGECNEYCLKELLVTR